MAPLASHPDGVNATERIVKCCECELTIALHPAQIGMRHRHVAIGNGRLWYVSSLGKWYCPEHDTLQVHNEVVTRIGEPLVEKFGAQPEPDMIAHPPHYESHPSGIQPIEITRHESFCLGNVIKYCMRAKYKGNEIQDLRKAAQYLQWEIERLEGK